MPKTVLRYELDKGQSFDPETFFNQSCSQNKKPDGQWYLLVKYNSLFQYICFLIHLSAVSS